MSLIEFNRLRVQLFTYLFIFFIREKDFYQYSTVVLNHENVFFVVRLLMVEFIETQLKYNRSA